jgi:hypothetical protein
MLCSCIGDTLPLLRPLRMLVASLPASLTRSRGGGTKSSAVNVPDLRRACLERGGIYHVSRNFLLEKKGWTNERLKREVCVLLYDWCCWKEKQKGRRKKMARKTSGGLGNYLRARKHCQVVER